ncbi:hypothetical protein QV65_13050 [Rhodococcus erythropolis]|nr:hypothetical protein QV65_13050 [Rhodococcus erythropolis]
MDEELFELCKEVYKRFPEWNDTRDFWWWDKRLYTPDDKSVSNGFELSEYMHNQFIVDDKQEGMPAYNSDYLLEKLPTKLAYNNAEYFYYLEKFDDGSYGSGYASPTRVDILIIR